MPRRKRQTALPRFILVVAAAVTVRRSPPVTKPNGAQTSSQRASGSPILGVVHAASATGPSFQTHERRAWGLMPRSWLSRKRRKESEGGLVDNATGGLREKTASRDAPRSSRCGFTCIRPSRHTPLWIRARGGADAQVNKGSLTAGVSESSAEEEEDEQFFEDLYEEVHEAPEDMDEVEVEVEEEDEDHEDDDPAVNDTTNEQDGTTSGVKGMGKTNAGAKGGLGAASQTLELGKVLPALIKQGLVFFMGTWLAKKLSPAVMGQVRAARMIYTAYLIFSQALCMYIRYLIWKRDDNTEMETPPPAQLKKMMDGVKAPGGNAGETAAAAGGIAAAAAAMAGGGENGGASPLGPMLDKMMTSKTTAKKYDMKMVQGIRRGQFQASLLMCYTHLRRGMIKPMILQVAFGILALLDSPLFKIYVLGKEAKGDLARPFAKQGLMATLSGPMEGMAAKAEEARVAAAAAAATAAAADSPSPDETERQKAGVDDSGEGDSGDEDDAMPDIELLTDPDD